MTWISDTRMDWVQSTAFKLLKLGPIPRHIGIIMDGNRRYARCLNQPVIYGHKNGFNKMKDALSWLSDLGVEEVTVYAFSIENFKREKEEVDNIMMLLKEKLMEFLSEREEVNKKGLRIRGIGNLSLLPADVRSLFAEAEEASKGNTKILLNMAVAYTAREEMTNSVNIILNEIKNGKISKDDFDETLLNNCLYTINSPPVELIIRTSGEMRLSDFLLFQGSFSYLHISRTFWPEFSPWSLFWAIFKYQRVMKTLKESSDYRIL